MTHSHTPRRALRPLAMAAAALFAWPGAMAGGPVLPQGLQAVQGQASVSTVGQRMTVTHSANALLNWQQFSIGAGQAVHFAQPSASSKVLNRVVGNDPSQIFGSLSSNGQVWLLNPHGVLFGASARVDVAGLVASTLRLGDAGWQAGLQTGRFSLAGNGLGASVVNQGELRSTSGGRVLLIGSAGVVNQGLVEAPDGQVLLAAGQSIDLVDTATPRLGVRLSAPQGEVLNLGRVLAGSGQIDLQAALVNQQGIVRADGLATGPGGQVLLSGSQGVTLGAASLTSASGAAGGGVQVDAGTGALLAAGRIASTGDHGAGGSVALLGRQVGLLDGAVVDASGQAGGGAVRVGGGLQGQEAGYRQAESVYFAPGAHIRADATGQGDGGLVVLWSNNGTRAYGSLSALGGPLGGNGGFIETSGGWIDAQPLTVRTGAPAGRAGTWLIDPQDILITDETSNSEISEGPDFTSTGGNSRLATGTIRAALNANNNVTVTTSSSNAGTDGEQRGDITMTDAFLSVSPTAAVKLTLRAIGDIRLNGTTVQSLGSPLGLQLSAGYLGGNVGDGDGSANGGAIRLTGASVNSAGGDIILGGASVACGATLGCAAGNTGAVASSATGLFNGVAINESVIDAGTGRILVSGHSLVGFTSTAGVLIDSGSRLNARVIDIHGTVDAAGSLARTGVQLDDATLIATERLTLRGSSVTVADPASSGTLAGVALDGNSFLQIGGQQPGNVTSALSIDGRVEGGAQGNGQLGIARAGVRMASGSGAISAQGGASIDITGEASGIAGDIGILLAGDGESGIDAAQGSRLSLHSGAAIYLATTLIAPTGGSFTAAAGGTLSIEGANISGAPSQADLSGALVSIGSAGQATSVSFTGGTAVKVSAAEFRLGSEEPFDDGDFVDGVAARDVPPKLALAFEPPSAQALLASAGAINVNADTVKIGIDGALYSSAEGTAISLAGQATGTGLVDFSNLAGASALRAPSGRWLVQARDSVGNDPGGFEPGALKAAFWQYGFTPGSTAPAAAGNGFAFSATPQLALAGNGTPSREYDGGSAVDLAALGFSITGLRSGQAVVGAPSFADKRAGEAKPLVMAAAAGGNTVLLTDGTPVYGYALDAQTLRGNITPRPLTLAGATAASKVYDGNASASVSGWSLSGLLEGDVVQVQAGSGLFGDANAGTAKSVVATVSSLAGADAGNYSSANLSRTLSADITPATLVYQADPLSLVQGTVLPALSGRVTGFVGNETQASATQGDLRFQASATGDAEPGRYAINGSGLSATNYRFVQAESNAQALTLTAAPPPPPPPSPSGSLDAQLNLYPAEAAVLAVLSQPRASSPGSGRAFDVLPGLLAGGSGQVFGSLDLDNLSAATVASVLAARDAYKKTVFQQALSALEANPGAADAPGCATAQQAATGQCLVINPLGTGLDISNARVVERAPIAVPAQPSAPPVATAPAPAAVAAAPSPTRPAPAPGGQALPASAPPPVALAARRPAMPADLRVTLPPRRAVARATLPQIQRKLAVVIGIDQYQDERIPRLSNAVADARAMADALESRLGYETLVLENAGRATIFRTLNQLAGSLGPADSVVLYYAGHGERVDKTGQGYWQPADADASRPETWISNADIDRLLRQLPAQQVALVSDSCFSGGLVSGERIRGVSATQDPAGLLGRRAVVVMTSGGNEPVFDSGQNGHSPFAWSLMQSMQQVGGWKPGSTLYEQVRFAVARKLPQRPQYGASAQGGHQSGADYLFEQRQLNQPAK